MGSLVTTFLIVWTALFGSAAVVTAAAPEKKENGFMQILMISTAVATLIVAVIAILQFLDLAPRHFHLVRWLLSLYRHALTWFAG